MKVVQCWDDGVTTDIRLTELLRKYNAKATFNLNPGSIPDVTGTPRWCRLDEPGWNFHGFSAGKIGMNDLLQVYDGFEVASHCWRHENAGSISDEAFLKAALDARHFLEDKFGKPCLGFAWPCGMYTPETCDLLQAAGFKYGRTTKKVDDVTKYEHPMAFHSNCHYMDYDFYDKYQAAKKTGVFYFWGHSYEMMQYEPLWDQLEQKIKMISEDPDAEWANVVDIVK